MSSQDTPGRLQTRILVGEPGTSRAAWSGHPVLPWKANLIALSQRENLYFIALNDTIYVDRPDYAASPFPGSVYFVHDLRWKLPNTREARQTTQHHNNRYLHGVNRLEIDFLGEQEVLVCVCDDGDVVVYNVDLIQAALEEIDEGLPQKDAVEKYTRPLHHSNVGKSAWGIAVQKQSRMLAVSSNKAEVTVYAFALSSEKPELLAEVPAIQASSQGDLDRSTDHIWQLHGHRTNIPALTFHCTKTAQPAVHLLSSDIDNNVFVWNLTSGSQLVCRINIQYQDLTNQYGWLVYAISPETYRIVEETEHLHGCADVLDCHESANIVPLAIHSTLDEQTEELTGSLTSSASEALRNMPFSILHTSTARLTLLHKPFSRIASCFVAPWRDRTPPFTDEHDDPGTMRYARFIPELGAVIAGADLGHVGIFTLTKLNRKNGSASNLGLRMDQILPLESQLTTDQQLLGFSGWGCLVGIATAPMPGSARSRWRLVLEYTNRTLLSYEIWRDAPSV